MTREMQLEMRLSGCQIILVFIFASLVKSLFSVFYGKMNAMDLN